MFQPTSTYSHLASLFRYPDPDMNEKLLSCQVILNTHYPEQGKLLHPFVAHLLQLDLDAKQELYTKTFDIQALCYLDLGYVIFGEDYKRGTFLMNMKKEQDTWGIPYAPELPDHLCAVLELIDIHPDRDFVDELVGRILHPAVEKNIGEFDSAKVELKLKALQKKHKAILQEETYFGNIYQLAFKVLLQVIETDFAAAIRGIRAMQESPATKDFLNGCQSYQLETSCSSCHS